MIDVSMGMHYLSERGLVHRVSKETSIDVNLLPLLVRIWQLVMYW